MASLRRVLQEYSGKPLTTMGQTDSEDPHLGKKRPSGMTANAKQDLRRDLEAVKRDNHRYFLICVVMILVLFVASIAVIFTNLGKPGLIKIAMAGFGVSTAGLITMMVNLWRVKSITEILLLLAVNMGPESVQTVINILSKRL